MERGDGEATSGAWGGGRREPGVRNCKAAGWLVQCLADGCGVEPGETVR